MVGETQPHEPRQGNDGGRPDVHVRQVARVELDEEERHRRGTGGDARDAHEEGVECQQRDEPPLAGADIERRREAIDQARVPTTGCVRLKRAVGGAAPTSVGSDR